MKRLITAMFLTAATTLPGCATSSGNYHTAYISPAQFQNYTCDELSAEIARIQTRVGQLMGKQSGGGATKDKWTLGTDLSLSWAALFALGGTKEQEAEYTQLKSEYDAVQRSAYAKKCPDAIPPIDNPPEFDPNLVKELGSDKTTSHQ